MEPSLHVRVFATVFAALLISSTVLLHLPGRHLRADGSSTAVFGPEVFQREQGKPQTYVRRFSVDNPTGRFNLEVINGDPEDVDDYKKQKKQRVGSAEILLNDIQIAGYDDLKKDVRRLSLPVTLNRGDNTLKITLKGDPVSMVSVAILKIDTPPSPDLIAPRVIAVDPLNGATGVPLSGTSVRVTFSEPVLLDTLSPSSFYVTVLAARGASSAAAGRASCGSCDGASVLAHPAHRMRRQKR